MVFSHHSLWGNQSLEIDAVESLRKSTHHGKMQLREDLRNAKSKIQKLEASTAASQASSISIELCNRKLQEEREKTDQRVASAAMERGYRKN